jgi:tRNA pseudouridine55 synthase
MLLHGVLVIDKPAGPTSHDVVARVRRALGVRRIGHTGTLDPLATGVLPLVIGRATRLSSMLSGSIKEYRAGVRFGAATATYDAEARMTTDPSTRLAVLAGPPPPAPAGLTADQIEAALNGFRGTFDQAPPPFSAKKIDGVRAYARARREQPVAPDPVRVTVDALRLVRYEDGLAELELTCSAGFYVRSLAHDLGRRLGCGAHLETLRRTRVGEFGIDRSVPLSLVESEGAAAASRLIGLGDLLQDVPGVMLTERGAMRATQGRDLGPADAVAWGVRPGEEAPAHGGRPRRWRLLDASGGLIGLAEAAPGGLLHPVCVLV